jgi:hypothetical protein
MSLLDKASLVVTPNAYKESKLYSVIPSDGSGDMVVSRATTATRVNSANLVEVVPRNLFTYSEEFDNAAWSKFQATVTANDTTAPNGTATADKLASSTNGTAVLFRTASTEAGVATISVYAKAGTNDVLDIGFTNVSDFTVKANLTTGTITSATSGITGTITNVGNGWYRVTATRTMTASGTAFINSATTISGRFIYIWGGQLDLGNVTEYFPTTTRLNIPRIDYTNGSCPSLLVESQRTNVQLNSEDFSNASWTKTLSVIVANQIASPSGNVDADKLNETATTGNHQLEASRTVTIGSYTMSVFAKKAEREWLYLFEDTTGKGAYFNLNTGVLGTIASGATAKIENYGNGWYRCSVTYSESGTFGRYRIAVTTGNGVTSYTGVANNGIYIWGAQYEAGAYATSYIPTVASSVTRNADVISKTGISSLIGQTEGTMFLDFYYNYSDSTTQVLLKASQSNDSNSVGIEIQNNSLKAIVNSSGSNIATLTNTISTGRIKCAIAYKSNDMVFYVNGSLVGTDTSGTINFANNVDMLTIGHFNLLGTLYFQSSRPFNSVQFYKTRLTNTELAQLTTL